MLLQQTFSLLSFASGFKSNSFLKIIFGPGLREPYEDLDNNTISVLALEIEGSLRGISFAVLVFLHAVHGVLKARTLKWFAIPFSSQS